MLDGSIPVAVRMAAYAARRHAILTKRELRAAGIPASTIAAWVQSGRLYRLYPGVYSTISPVLLTQEGRWLAAVSACEPHAFLSHGPSLQLHQLLERRIRFALAVSMTGRRAVSPQGILVHRPRDLPPRDTTTRYSIPTTTATRAIWDISVSQPQSTVRAAFEKAERRDRLDRTRLTELAASHPNRKGSGFIRTLLAEQRLPAADVHSWLEDLLWTICTSNRLPLPAVNVPLLGWEVDFLWEEARFVVEADGGDHLTPRQRDLDNERDFELGQAGYLVRRYSSAAMADERRVVAEVLRILRSRC